jgi:hypothetical protein
VPETASKPSTFSAGSKLSTSQGFAEVSDFSARKCGRLEDVVATVSDLLTLGLFSDCGFTEAKSHVEKII